MKKIVIISLSILFFSIDLFAQFQGSTVPDNIQYFTISESKNIIDTAASGIFLSSEYKNKWIVKNQDLIKRVNGQLYKNRDIKINRNNILVNLEFTDYQKLDSVITDFSKTFHYYDEWGRNIKNIYRYSSDKYRYMDEFTYDSLSNLISVSNFEWDYSENKWLLIGLNEATYVNNILDSTVGYEWYDNILEDKYKSEYNYDSNNNLLEEISYLWDTIKGQWGNYYKKNSNYDSSNNVKIQTSYFWDSDSVRWENSSKNEYIYNSNNEKIESTEMSWTEGEWKNIQKNIYSYDTHSNLILNTENFWDNSNEKWSPSTKEEHQYDIMNRPIFTFISMPDPDVWDEELFKTDGTTKGTTLVKDIYPGPVGSYPEQLVYFNGAIYFDCWTPSFGREFMKTDGTSEGTGLLKDINPIGNSTPRNLININGTLYFVANNGTNGFELWKSDGTENGTQMIKDIYKGEGRSIPITFTGIGGMSFSQMNNILYFHADDSVHGIELWRSDGTLEGTIMIKDIKEGSGSSVSTLLYNMPEMNEEIYFTAKDGAHGYELWKTDGTTVGTVMVKDIMDGTGSSSPEKLINVNGMLYFVANNGLNGNELWKSDGTPDGTVMVKDITEGTSSSNLFSLSDGNGTLYFGGDDGVHGAELWKSDGSEEGTILIKDINPGSSSSSPQEFTYMKGMLYFRANTTTGNDLWKSDGTTQGTEMVISHNPSSLTVFDGMLYYISSYSLYKTDGTTEGTIRITNDIDYFQSLAFLNNEIYYRGFNRNYWKENVKVTYSYSYTCPVENLRLPYYKKYISNGMVDITTASMNVQNWDPWNEIWINETTGKYFSGIETLYVSKDSIIFPSSDSSSLSFDIYSNVNWSVNCDQTWLSFGSEEGLNVDTLAGSGDATIKLIAAANPSLKSRTAIVTVSGTGVNDKIIIVTQEGIPTVINEIKEEITVIFPNPASNLLYFINIRNGDKISIFDLTGKLVLNKQLNDNYIDISNLQTGIYTLKIKTSNGTVIKEFIKQ